MKKATLALVVTGILGWSLTGSATTGVTNKCRPRVCVGGGGVDVPTPFESTNRKVELSDGEDYTLEGYVVNFDPGWDSLNLVRAFLRVDFDRHPWLASAKRKGQPYYALEGSPSFWKDLELHSVQIRARAVGRIVQTRRGPEYVISLRPMGDVVLLQD